MPVCEDEDEYEDEDDNEYKDGAVPLIDGYDKGAWYKWKSEYKGLKYCTECHSYSSGDMDCAECDNGTKDWEYKYCGDCRFFSFVDNVHFLEGQCMKCMEFEFLGITWAYLHGLMARSMPAQARIAFFNMKEM